MISKNVIKMCLAVMCICLFGIISVSDSWFKESELLKDIQTSSKKFVNVERIIDYDRNFFNSEIYVEYLDGTKQILYYDSNITLRSKKFSTEPHYTAI